MRRALLVLAGACGGKHPAPPVVIANAAPPADAAETDASEVSCEPPVELPITVAGKTATVSLVSCTTGDHASSEQARQEGFIEHERIARLTFTGKPPSEIEILTWTDGWEWGSSVELAGVLQSAAGDGVAILRFGSSGTGPGIAAHSARVVAYRLGSDGWRPHEVASAASLEVTLAPDGKSMTVDGCEEDTDPAAPGCGGYTDAKPIATLHVTYDGKDLDIQ